jgi:hypothetical protein
MLIVFAMATFFKFVLFSVFEARYLVVIWKAGNRSSINGEGYEATRHELWRELSLIHSCLCKSSFELYMYYLYCYFMDQN